MIPRIGLIVSLLLSISTFASQDYIVKIDKNKKIQDVIGDAKYEVLVPSLNIYLVKLDQKADPQTFFKSVYVQYYQEDHAVTLRESPPNDPLFSQIWSLDNQKGSHIDAIKAWSDFGTGGKNKDGQDVVVAVVDGGMDIKHEDLINNLWFNPNETPGNNIDDDNNGFIDDVNGWNVYNNNGAIPPNSHGTHVGGIIGAAGNNGKHTVGVNWNVKIMAVAASSGTTSVIVKGYGYVIEQKKAWLESGGTKGANVVSTNSSFGVDYGKCETGEFPVWNDLYNKMGELGILSAAATANIAIDVDVVGDVPTGCSSEHIVTVTNTTVENKKNAGAGWGKTTIDIGAPGTSILSTVPGNKTQLLTGTSMATPQIAGAVAYLHSVASNEFSELFKLTPGKGALVLKQLMINTVDVITDLDGKTVSNGKLNLYKAALAINQWKADEVVIVEPPTPEPIPTPEGFFNRLKLNLFN